MNVPEKLINFRVYENGNDLVGVADVELPSLETMTETVKGAGVAGEVDSPVMGHFGSMELTLNWRTLEKTNIKLAVFGGVALDLRSSQQVYDSNSATLKTIGTKVVIRGIPKNTELGKLEVGTTTDTSNVIEVTYLKVDIDGETVLEVDKYNFICVINGVDYLASVRENLGLA